MKSHNWLLLAVVFTVVLIAVWLSYRPVERASSTTLSRPPPTSEQVHYSRQEDDSLINPPNPTDWKSNPASVNKTVASVLQAIEAGAKGGSSGGSFSPVKGGGMPVPPWNRSYTPIENTANQNFFMISRAIDEYGPNPDKTFVNNKIFDLKQAYKNVLENTPKSQEISPDFTQAYLTVLNRLIPGIQDRVNSGPANFSQNVQNLQASSVSDKTKLDTLNLLWNNVIQPYAEAGLPIPSEIKQTYGNAIGDLQKNNFSSS